MCTSQVGSGKGDWCTAAIFFAQVNRAQITHTWGFQTTWSWTTLTTRRALNTQVHSLLHTFYKRTGGVLKACLLDRAVWGQCIIFQSKTRIIRRGWLGSSAPNCSACVPLRWEQGRVIGAPQQFFWWVVNCLPWQEPPRLRLLGSQSPAAPREPTPLLRLLGSHSPAAPKEPTPLGPKNFGGGIG